MEFDGNRIQYLGYHKLLFSIDEEKLNKQNRVVKINFSHLPVGGTLEWQDAQTLGVSEHLAARLRSIAPKKISELSKIAVRPPLGNVSFSGQWIEFSGETRMMLRYHDDFRQQKPAPEIVLWFSCTPNGDGTCTHMLFHGTPEGNLWDHHLGSVPKTRSGSSTERVFEYLWAEATNLKLENWDSYEPTPDSFAEIIDWIVGMSSESSVQNVEVLARVTRDFRIRKKVYCSHPDRSDESYITRMIIASPIIVQSQPNNIQTNNKLVTFIKRVLT